jgi:hypothetical protein
VYEEKSIQTKLIALNFMLFLCVNYPRFMCDVRVKVNLYLFSKKNNEFHFFFLPFYIFHFHIFIENRETNSSLTNERGNFCGTLID